MEVLVVGEAFLELNHGNGDTYTKNPGGKGLEIALAAASLGYKTTLLSSLGNDPFGCEIKEILERKGVQTRLLPTQKTPILFSKEETFYHNPTKISLPDKKYEIAILLASCITAQDIQERKKKGEKVFLIRDTKFPEFHLADMTLPLMSPEQIVSRALGKPPKEDLDCICFLTCDQTNHFENRSTEEILRFKELLFNAFIRTLLHKHTARLGLALDNFHGKDILTRSQKRPYAVMRTVEKSSPLSFPQNEIIKVMFNLKEGDLQINWLKSFYETIRETEHRFLIEIYDKETESREARVIKALSQIYSEGIYPDLWMLQPSFDLTAWGHIEEAIENQDPKAGILLLGDRLPIKELAKELEKLKRQCPKIKGFAIGRVLWNTLAEHWFEKRISDEMVESEVAYNFNRLLHIWENPEEYHAEEFEEKALDHLRR